MLYLLAVMATAVLFGRGPAVFASFSSFLIFDWFFVEPHHQLTVADPEEWVSLLIYLLTATVIGQLAAGQRQRAREAQERQREAVVLYDVVRLLGEADLDRMLEAVAERLRQELQLKALAIELWQPTGATTRYSAGDTQAIASVRGGSSAARVLQSVRSPRTGTPRPDAGCGSFIQLAAPLRARTYTSCLQCGGAACRRVAPG